VPKNPRISGIYGYKNFFNRRIWLYIVKAGEFMGTDWNLVVNLITDATNSGK